MPKTIDARKLCCPLPILELSKGILEVEPGASIFICATDVAFESDLQAWVFATGHQLVSLERREGELRAHIRKAAR